MKRLIIYDLDGTLVDTLQDITEAANHMLSAMQAPLLTPDHVRRFVGKGIQQLVSDCLGTDDPGRLAQGLSIYRSYYSRHLADHSALYPGARELLEHFRARQQAVITNKPNPDSRDLLTALGVAGYFFDIIGGDAPHPRKPDPASAQSVMQRAGAAPAETLFVGDSPIDIETGRRAGVFTVVVTHGLVDAQEIDAASPDTMVSDLRELLDLAKTRRW